MKRLCFLTFILLLACAGPFRRGHYTTNGPVPFQTILAGAYSLADSFSVRLISDDDDWENTWLLAKGRVSPLPDIPTVDFDHQCVVAAFMGKRPSSGYRIEITAIEKKGRNLNVHVTNYETPGMLTVITSPFYLARIPKGDYKLNVIKEVVQ